MDPELASLVDERNRAHAYGLHRLVEIADAEIGKRMYPSVAPEGRQPPQRETAAAETPKRGPGRPRTA